MKNISILFLLSLLSLVGCQEKSSKKSSSSTSQYNCTGNNYYYMPGCPGYMGGTTGTTTGGTTGNTQNCYGNNYYYTPGCPGFCLANPGSSSCGGSSTGGVDNGGWTGKYPPGTLPQGSCQAAVKPDGFVGTPFDTRKATMTIVGKSWYNPSSPEAPHYMTTSSVLTSVTRVKDELFDTDSVLKIRFKVNEQPDSSTASPYCYGRQKGDKIAGYTKLQFNVKLVGYRSDFSIGEEPLGTYTIGVNSCTPAISLSKYLSTYPNGVYVVVQSVKGNQGYIPDDYETNGFKNVNMMVDIRTSDCWSLDIEVAADGTKTFN
jgi:hypothetical protein